MKTVTIKKKYIYPASKLQQELTDKGFDVESISTSGDTVFVNLADTETKDPKPEVMKHVPDVKKTPEQKKQDLKDMYSVATDSQKFDLIAKKIGLM